MHHDLRAQVSSSGENAPHNFCFMYFSNLESSSGDLLLVCFSLKQIVNLSPLIFACKSCLNFSSVGHSFDQTNVVLIVALVFRCPMGGRFSFSPANVVVNLETL